MINFKIKIILIAIFFIVAASASMIFLKYYSHQDKESFALISIGKTKLKAEIASTPEKRYQGLSGRTELGKNEAMLFIFDKPDQYPFAMRGMKFSLDFIFVDGFTIVGFEKNITPENNQPIEVENSYDKVIEVDAGFIDSHDIKVGDRIEI